MTHHLTNPLRSSSQPEQTTKQTTGQITEHSSTSKRLASTAFAATLCLTFGFNLTGGSAWATLPSIMEAPDALLVDEALLPAPPPSRQRFVPHDTSVSNESQAEPSIEALLNTLENSAPSHTNTLTTTRSTNTEQSTASKESVTPKPSPTHEAVATSSAAHALPKELQNLSGKAKEELIQRSKHIHEEHQAIGNNLRDIEETAYSDIMMLWQAAVEHNGTIRFAIEKLSRRSATGTKAGPSFTKKLMHQMLGLAGTAGSMLSASPAGVLTGQLANDLISGDPTTSAMARVTDADMIIIAKEVEALQNQLIQKYYTYRNAEEQWELARQAKQTLENYYHNASQTADGIPNPTTQALLPILSTLYEDVAHQEQLAKQAFSNTQRELTYDVGKDAMVALKTSRRKETASNK